MLPFLAFNHHTVFSVPKHLGRFVDDAHMQIACLCRTKLPCQRAILLAFSQPQFQSYEPIMTHPSIEYVVPKWYLVPHPRLGQPNPSNPIKEAVPESGEGRGGVAITLHHGIDPRSCFAKTWRSRGLARSVHKWQYLCDLMGGDVIEWEIVIRVALYHLRLWTTWPWFGSVAGS